MAALAAAREPRAPRGPGRLAAPAAPAPREPEPTLTLDTPHLRLQTLQPAAAALLPADREGALAVLGAGLDAEWPLPDVLDLLPSHAQRPESELPFSVWVMVEAATGTVVGDIGFLGPPDAAGEVEIGYSVVPSRRGRGYASEAVAGLASWALAQAGVTAVVAGTDPGNVVSQRILERTGFARTAVGDTEIRWRLERKARGV